MLSGTCKPTEIIAKISLLKMSSDMVGVGFANFRRFCDDLGDSKPTLTDCLKLADDIHLGFLK
jgi:hypothetical protein